MIREQGIVKSFFNVFIMINPFLCLIGQFNYINVHYYLQEQNKEQLITYICRDEEVFMKKGKKRLRDMTWDDYGISRNRYKELKAFCMQYEEKQKSVLRGAENMHYADRYAVRNVIYCRDCRMIEEAAITAAPGIWQYIIKSVTQDLPYEAVEYSGELGRIIVGKTDFYAYRRLFYYCLDGLRIGDKSRVLL